MRRTLMCICIFATICVNLIGCSSSETKIDNIDTQSTETSSTTSEEDSVSDVSNDVSESSAGNSWKVKNYVDEFNDPTDEKYISYVGVGTFSNTATTDSTLVLSVLYDGSLYVKLYEYGSSLVTNSYSHSVEYTVMVKDEDGQKSEYEGTMYSDSGDRVKIWGSELIEKFKSNKTLKFHIVNNDRPTTTYDFTIDTSGFKEVYEEYKK